MTSPKVVILKDNLDKKGGLEKYTFRMARAFAKKGAEVAILTMSQKQHRQPSDFEIVNLASPAPLGFFRLRQYDQLCQQWIQENHPDIIFGMDRNTFQTHYRAGNGVHAEYLQKRSHTTSFLRRFSFKVNPLHRTILNMEKAAFEHPFLCSLFANSVMVRNDILKHYAIEEKKIHVVHNGVEWHEMQEDFDQWESRREELMLELGLNPSRYQFLFVGSGYRRKGLQYLLKGLAKFPPDKFQLSVIGKDKELGLFINFANSLNLIDNVKFFGSRNDVRSFYQIADTLAIPSIYDPFANATIEALAMGLFVISSKSNGASEILTPQNGKIIENLIKEETMVETLKDALRRPKTPESAQRIRESVKNLDFSCQLEKVVAKTLKI